MDMECWSIEHLASFPQETLTIESRCIESGIAIWSPASSAVPLVYMTLCFDHHGKEMRKVHNIVFAVVILTTGMLVLFLCCSYCGCFSVCTRRSGYCKLKIYNPKMGIALRWLAGFEQNTMISSFNTLCADTSADNVLLSDMLDILVFVRVAV